MNTKRYYNTKKQLEMAIPLCKELYEHLDSPETLPIKRSILDFLEEIAVTKDTSLALNELILTISNYLITYPVSLTADNTTRLKKLYALLCA